jgi:diacylglycerol kinase (ATP)
VEAKSCRTTQLTSKADQVIVLVNPTAGRGKAEVPVQQMNEILRDRGYHVQVVSDLTEGSILANRCHADGRLRSIVAVGGDGTVAEVVNRTDIGVPIAILPMGTANLLAKYFGLTSEPKVVSDAIDSGTVIHLDAGQANDRIFLIMATCGFDADVVERLHAARRGPIRLLSYAKPIMQAIRSYQYPQMRIYFTERAANGSVEEERETVR